MKPIPKQEYTAEFKEQAVKRGEEVGSGEGGQAESGRCQADDCRTDGAVPVARSGRAAKVMMPRKVGNDYQAATFSIRTSSDMGRRSK